MADTHEIIITNEVRELTRDRIRINVACSTPGCLVGKVSGSPSAQIVLLVESLREHHAASLHVEDGNGGAR